VTVPRLAFRPRRALGSPGASGEPPLRGRPSTSGGEAHPPLAGSADLGAFPSRCRSAAVEEGLAEKRGGIVRPLNLPLSL
jgi:hypothetical protein